jgi:7-cyano-7-deazaguanine synthase
MESAVVLLSGGQDSTTCLFWAIHKCGGPEQVRALSFDYGQRHLTQETKAVARIASLAKVHHQWLSLNAFWEIGNSALIVNSQDISDSHPQDDSLPASFVPGRNLIFLALAGAYGYKHGISDIVIGASQTDYSGYPDCRDFTIKTMALAVSFGLDKEVTVHTPLMHLDKSGTVDLAENLPGCMYALRYSHTCYEGQYPPCGECPACKIRAAGFENAGARDPLIVRYYSDESSG